MSCHPWSEDDRGWWDILGETASRNCVEILGLGQEGQAAGAAGASGTQGLPGEEADSQDGLKQATLFRGKGWRAGWEPRKQWQRTGGQEAGRSG